MRSPNSSRTSARRRGRSPRSSSGGVAPRLAATMWFTGWQLIARALDIAVWRPRPLIVHRRTHRRGRCHPCLGFDKGEKRSHWRSVVEVGLSCAFTRPATPEFTPVDWSGGKRPMALSPSTLAVVVVGMSCALTAAQKDGNLLRTPDGHPDLQGIWVNNTLTPLERPKRFADKEYLTEAEVAAYEK